jgi:hypothetical protein
VEFRNFCLIVGADQLSELFLEKLSVSDSKLESDCASEVANNCSENFCRNLFGELTAED